MLKNRFRIVTIIILIFVVTISTIIFAVLSKDIDLLHLNGQTGFIYKGDIDSAILDEHEYSLYSTIKENITIKYESLNLDNNYTNEIQIGDYRIDLESQSDIQLEFTKNEIEILGTNVRGSELVLNIKSGVNIFNTYDTFKLRNIRIEIGNLEIWSNEYNKDNYENTPLNFGSDDLSSNYRTNYTRTKTFTFNIPDELLKYTGTLLDIDQKSKIYYEIGNKRKLLTNDSYLDFNVNIDDEDVIDSDFELQIDASETITNVNAYMDGILIPNNLKFSANAWADGEHNLLVIAENEYGNILEKSYKFNLDSCQKSDSSLEYNMFENGINLELKNEVSNLGEEITDIYNWDSPFSKYAVQNFIITDNDDDKTIIWEGNAPEKRTLYMQIYNWQLSSYDTVSTSYQSGVEDVKLGFDYSGDVLSYLNDGKVYMRIVSQNIQTDFNTDTTLFHVTDTQYITQKGISSSSYISGEAASALNSMSDYMIDQKNNEKLIYTMMTGDYVQSVSNGTKEWPFVMDEFFQPLINETVNFGVSSGNHDIGALSEISVNGVNALDSDLYYDYYNLYLGEDTFDYQPSYINNFQDNRSHYDEISINGVEYLFLYLGWGSSQFGIHVSSKDIDYAKSVLASHPDKTVVLLTHDYMGNEGNRTITGEYIYYTLVRKYFNIQFVFSGHVNGSSSRIDTFDTDGDGIKDRQVLQQLTNFQEEEELFGASYIRRINFDFTNNFMLFDIYSPYFNDADIYVSNHEDTVKDNRFFVYDYDLNNVEYGLHTEYLG
ncbi:metallophosphoesterase [Mycoplasmatota bacterium WC30]